MLSDTMRLMRHFASTLLALTLICGMISAQAPGNGDEEAVRKVVAEYMKARNSKDAEAVRRLFTEDADQLVSTGEWRRGIDDLVRGTSASSQREAPKSSIDVERVRFVDPTVALVDGRYRTVSRDGTTRYMWTTMIMKSVGHDWRISAIRNMLPAPSH
jgi:uncharacterized protein (TIGR02246 family)